MPTPKWTSPATDKTCVNESHITQTQNLSANTRIQNYVIEKVKSNVWKKKVDHAPEAAKKKNVMYICICKPYL